MERYTTLVTVRAPCSDSEIGEALQKPVLSQQPALEWEISCVALFSTNVMLVMHV